MDTPGTNVRNRNLAAQQVLTDREGFRLDWEAFDAWERINQRRARSLKGLLKLLGRPSPFQE